jgi:uncharacterized membrane protein
MIEIIIAFILFLVIDTPYLLYIAGDYYKNLITNIQKSPLNIRYTGAILTYIIMSIAVKYLILDKSKNKKDIIINSLLVGFVGYGLYDFTNYTTFTKWTLKASILDVIWGMILFTMVSYLTFIIL